MLNQKKIGFIVLLASLATSGALAGTFTNYAVGDTLICFRPNAGGSYDLVVDAGPVSVLTNAVPNQRLAITNYTGSQLALVGTNSISFSAFTWFDDSVTPVSAQWTLFVSRARTALNTQAAAWQENAASSQQIVALDMANNVESGAQSCWSPKYNANSTPSAVIEPDDADNKSSAFQNGGLSYIGALGGTLDFNSDFQGNPENNTPTGFTTSGTVVRSDFFQLSPVRYANGKALGFFEFNTNGAMTYVAYPTKPAVTTVAASAVTAAGAQLNATVATINTNFDKTSFFFQYGLSQSYGSTTVVSNLGTASGSYGVSVSSLAGGTLYHFRAAAYNQYGTNYGSDLTFTTAGGAPVAPFITAINRTNNVSYVSFTTGSFGTYTLRGTNSLTSGAAKTNWPALGSTSGTGGTATLNDTNSGSGMFYIITAQ